MLDKIHQEVTNWDRIRRSILSNAPYWPEYAKKQEGNAVIYGAYVRIWRNDKWYRVPVVECYVHNGGFVPAELFEKLARTAHQVQHCYVINDHITARGMPLQEIDPLQISEQERLTEMYKLGK